MFVKSEKRHNHGFVMVDIDNFKMLNDSYGHIVGDQVLKEIAYTLKSTGKTDDVIARLGGDEFVICMKNVGSSHALAKRLETLRKGLPVGSMEILKYQPVLGHRCTPKTARPLQPFIRKRT